MLQYVTYYFFRKLHLTIPNIKFIVICCNFLYRSYYDSGSQGQPCALWKLRADLNMVLLHPHLDFTMKIGLIDDRPGPFQPSYHIRMRMPVHIVNTSRNYRRPRLPSIQPCRRCRGFASMMGNLHDINRVIGLESRSFVQQFLQMQQYFLFGSLIRISGK